VELWTQRINVAWWRSLRFFERRFEVLRTFEDGGLLRQFRVDDDEVGMRLGDANHSLAFGVLGLDGSLYQPDADADRLRNAIRVVFDALEPERLSHATFGLQWLVPLDVSYDEAREAAARVAMPVNNFQPKDFALFSDGESRDPEATIVLECGVVGVAELPQRLARQVGRMGPPDRSSPPTLWPADRLPEVAFFCDSNWIATQALESLDDLFHLWEGTQRASAEVVSELMSHFNLAPHE
jgi:hypothetical protein